MDQGDPSKRHINPKPMSPTAGGMFYTTNMTMPMTPISVEYYNCYKTK